MSFDGIFTYAMTKELQEKLESGRISKIYQPYKNELILQVRSGGANYKLLVSAHPSYARIHLTNESYENPSSPPMFCMLLRKHLEGSIIERIEQKDMERIIIFHVKGRNELGDVTYKELIVEIMGRHSNMVLLDSETRVILDSIKHLPPAVNSYRTVLPGHEYIFPPAQEKISPFGLTEEDVVKKLDFFAGRLDKQIVQHFAGISPLLAREITERAGMANRVTVPKAFIETLSSLQHGDWTPVMITGNDKDAFYLTDLTHLKGERKTFSSLSGLLDRYYFGKADRDRVKQQGNDLERFLQNELKKNKSKIKKLHKSLLDAEDAEKYQLYGELLTANLYSIQRGDKQAEVINYYDENESTVSIQLSPQKTPSENAQSYFIKYQKAKKSVNHIEEQLKLADEEIRYLDNLLQQIESASPRDLEEIREELQDGGYMKKKALKKGKKAKTVLPVLEQYHSTDGIQILVGKNNKQNEYLTNRVAARDDVWLHTKDIPGSHVVIKSRTPSEDTILEAANIAAYFSKARSSGSVPVDFTLVRHVKKPSGSKPGFVIYDHQQTVFVTPDPDLVKRLKE
ncbi:fibronectin/fibrinogen-binding protein [Bacillus sp. FJAT-42376]|uniref:Rqc2 family fibronectin-binding protein n=1 Tax=Bacillus sp. FJAT-42376 TaxID=2014076 RepID=UPI000F4DEF77|nr:NFACT RNA binding domain-containing protein [Bacillus sp. FJAT-42376]AZB42881.1 fibronectin/fibrinogen-binding protein [Bacillus sp. FJAT-42376]